MPILIVDRFQIVDIADHDCERFLFPLSDRLIDLFFKPGIGPFVPHMGKRINKGLPAQVFNLVMAFFDFDPSKRELVPNPNVAQKVAKAMDCIYGQLTMVIPVEGNNIEMLEYTDSKDSLSYKIHFDGSSFRFDPKGKKISK